MVEETLIIKVGLEAVETSEEETLEVASEVVVAETLEEVEETFGEAVDSEDAVGSEEGVILGEAETLEDEAASVDLEEEGAAVEAGEEVVIMAWVIWKQCE